MGEQRDHRREDPERDVARDVGALQPEHDGDDLSGETDEHGGQERLSHESGDHSSSHGLAVHRRVDCAAGAAARRTRVRRWTWRWDADAMRSRWRSRGSAVFGVDARFDAVRDATLTGERSRRSRARLVRRSDRASSAVVAIRRDRGHALPAAESVSRVERSRPSGRVVLYETFTTAQRALGTGPTSPDHLLEPGELRQAFDGFEVLFYEEVTAPEAVARIAARALGQAVALQRLKRPNGARRGDRCNGKGRLVGDGARRL